MDQTTYFLNQKVGERYLYSGTRYDQEPVTDITALPVPPTETAPYLATGNTVPAYDADYDPMDPTALVPAANTNASAAIDSSSTLTYGITSNEDGFQQVIMGLRWAYAATQDPANYESYMATANNLLTTGLSNVRATHTSSTNAYNRLETAESLIEQNVSSLLSQSDDISKVDLNEVSVKITTLEAQLQASYSATSIMLQLSLTNYI
jgi:flagellin-like hook-associated protein FlgL